MVSDRAFIFRMSIPCDKNFLLVPRSRSSVNVKVNIKVAVFEKTAVAGALAFLKHSLFIYKLNIMAQLMDARYFKYYIMIGVFHIHETFQRKGCLKLLV